MIDDYWAMVLADIHGACDVFSKVFDQTGGLDGYVSVEVDPGLAHDGPGTEAAARELHQKLNRRNLMVKIPATVEGLPAIRQMIAEGRCINVTLIFSLERYQAVMEAYVSGLEAFAADATADLSQVSSVASFFISRVDTEVDRRLDEIGTDEALALRGRRPSPRVTSRTRRSSPRSAGRAGQRSRRVAHGSSVHCGRAPARRTPPTPTCSTSTR